MERAAAGAEGDAAAASGATSGVRGAAAGSGEEAGRRLIAAGAGAARALRDRLPLEPVLEDLEPEAECEPAWLPPSERSAR